MISLIVALDQNRVIGYKNRLPWHLPADLAHFKQTTLGHPVVMGRKTFEAIGKPLPERQNVILTSDPNYQAAGCTVLHSVDDVLKLANTTEVFVIGGAWVFTEFLPYAAKIYLTRIEQSFPGDTFFPEVNWDSWQEVSRTPGERNEKNPYAYSFLVYQKK